LFFCEGCKTAPVTGRRQLNFISSDDEMQLGLTSFDQLKKETPVSKDAAANALVQRVGKRIAAVADKDMPGAQWEFVVFDSKEANAFCLPGGKVGIFTGILPITKNEAGLATVVAHEIGHAVAHHGAERMSEAKVIAVGQSLVGSAVTNASPLMQSAAVLAYGVGAQLGRELPHSRKQESEADQIGLTYMARAGYEPKEAINFWQRFSDYNEKAGGGDTIWFLRTHPLNDVRIKQLQGWLPAAEVEYSQSKKN
jgi:predicted Zn-dependent protease